MREKASCVCAWISVFLTLFTGIFVIVYSFVFPLEGAMLTIGVIGGIAIMICGVLMLIQVRKGAWRV